MNRAEKKGIGAFFTPLDMAKEMILSFGIHKKWKEGARLLDPTAGQGNLLEALILTCLEEGLEINTQMLQSLKGWEREDEFLQGFPERIQKRYSLTIPEDCLEQGDFLAQESDEFDIILGNPPWLNFTDAPENEKEYLKTQFIHYGLVESGKNLLLGQSRIDLAALIIQKAMECHLKSHGEAYFFIPLSLLFNEGAHNQFRKGRLKNSGNFAFMEVLDFKQQVIFQDVSTRSGFIYLKKSEKQKQIIPYKSLKDDGQWEGGTLTPLSVAGSSYKILDGTIPPPLIRIPKASKPRQGINTGGQNSLFIFDRILESEAGLILLENRTQKAWLPSELVYPLITSKQFKNTHAESKYVFLPYNRNGKVLNTEEISTYPAAMNYLNTHRTALENRKGVLLQSAIRKGSFWALLGVGSYSFSPWKIVWEAYGKKDFNPQLFMESENKPWIPNQALQASCSFETESEALKVLKALQNPAIEQILKTQNMEGTCNWAQPGRMSHFFEYL